MRKSDKRLLVFTDGSHGFDKGGDRLSLFRRPPYDMKIGVAATHYEQVCDLCLRPKHQLCQASRSVLKHLISSCLHSSSLASVTQSSPSSWSAKAMSASSSKSSMPPEFSTTSSPADFFHFNFKKKIY